MAERVRQAAAIPILAGNLCLISSRNSKRWVIPKGLIDPGFTAAETAMNEAWEEAGLRGLLSEELIGNYSYEKFGTLYRVAVYEMRVAEALPEWPEMHFRERIWVTPPEAIELISEPGLRAIVGGLFSLEQDRSA